MRTVEYLSPTSIGVFYKDKQEFYLNYLSDNRPPKLPQTQPMSVGSSFDAHVKSYLHEALFGKDNDPRFSLEAIFESQVEPQNRDWALKAGAYAFACYKSSGALVDLMSMLQTAVDQPRFEFDIHGAVNGYREGVENTIGAVILFGKPDVHFKTKDGTDVILDWKVNGYCGNHPTSPAKGYIKLRDGWVGNQSRNHNQQHKDAFVMEHKGVMINLTHPLEDVNLDWANQLAIYGWLLGFPVGGDFIVAIDQLACSPGIQGPSIRVAEHRTRVSEKHQYVLFEKAQHVWEVVHSDHIFRELSFEESKKKCEALDLVSAGVSGDSEEDKWFRSMSRGQ